MIPHICINSPDFLWNTHSLKKYRDIEFFIKWDNRFIIGGHFYVKYGWYANILADGYKKLTDLMYFFLVNNISSKFLQINAQCFNYIPKYYRERSKTKVSK